jgi:lysylphosphatidylglycerol synthetase-like protein (DUF2156 family)
VIAALGDLLDLTRNRLLAPSARPPHVEEASSPACRARMLDLLARHSDQAGQTHALSRDRWRVSWSPGGRAFVPFHERKFALVAWRDPVGPVEARAEALRAFRDLASARGKHAIVLAAGEEMRRTAEREGFGTTWVGSEQYFDLSRFHTRGKPGEKLRLAMNHARREGAVAREIDPLHVEQHRHAIDAAEAAWKRARPQRDTRSFLRTEPMENATLRRYFAVERVEGGQPRFESFVVCAPVSDRGWYLQDLVRRPDAPRGTAELVSVCALETLRDDGFDFATMGIVPFFDPKGARGAAPSSDGVVKWCIRHFDQHYGFAGLQQFRAKFPADETHPRFALYWPKVLTPWAVWDLVSVTR